jgi:CRP-like cAMP-binding protein
MLQSRQGDSDHRRGIPEPWLAALGTIASPLQCPAGSVLLEPCEQVDSVLLLIAGVAKQTQGESMLVAVHSQGSLLGTESVLCGSPYRATVTALTPCTVARIRAAAFVQELEKAPLARGSAIREVARQADELMRTAASLIGCPARRRIVWAVREVIRKGSVPLEDGSRWLPFSLPVTEIASMAGTERETASRVLSDLLKRGVLVREAGCLGIPPPRTPGWAGPPRNEQAGLVRAVCPHTTASPPGHPSRLTPVRRDRNTRT